MDCDQVSSRLGKDRYVPLRLDDHEVRFEQHLGGRANALEDGWTDCDVGHKAAVHHIDVETIGSPLLCLLHCLAQMQEIAGQDGGSDLNPAGDRWLGGGDAHPAGSVEPPCAPCTCS